MQGQEAGGVLVSPAAIHTSALGYRQVYRRLGAGEHGYRRLVFRISDDAQMYAGPGTGPLYPPRRHPDWAGLPREERLAVQAALDAQDELTGIADYLSERSGRDAVARVATARGIDPQGLLSREVDDVRRAASQIEYERVLGGTLLAARARLAGVLRGDRDAEATRRIVRILDVADPCDVTHLAVDQGSGVAERPSEDGRAVSVVRWLPRDDTDATGPETGGVPIGIGIGAWMLGTGRVPPDLGELAGLRPDGALGPMIEDAPRIARWRTRLRRDVTDVRSMAASLAAPRRGAR